ncbi:hypothetical protein C5167_000679 [Papaver somniferum]|uniref:Uncharacterized protein n=1 Tax=Papaver somniferum TaxID=3469 RepID=A0A4Y7KX98_PAPSO|nr:uncharacterized protein LOC113311023 [Papaver somniferum]RZC76579.1 hypothetical protein C5167_000679 [Papaver somniferum]
MKTVSGFVLSSEPVSLSKASSILKNFVSSENGASHALRVYVKRTYASLNGLAQYHSNLESGKSERKLKRKPKAEVSENGVLADTGNNYQEEEVKSVGNTEEGIVKTEGKKKKRKKVEEETEDGEERDISRSNKKRKH